VRAASALLLIEEAQTRAGAAAGSDPTSPWAVADGWRLGHAGHRRLVLDDGAERHTVIAHGTLGDYRLEDDDGTVEVQGARLADGTLFARFNGQGYRLRLDMDQHTGSVTRVDLHDGERRWRFMRVPAYQAASEQAGAAGDRALAPMPGRIVLIKTQVGDHVEQGQELLVMEAMKMELTLKAPCSGAVAEIRVAIGDFVEADAALVVLHAHLRSEA
jgi:3-methylcrotonyl-CoA carboxylase alpha subunit